MKVRLSLEQPIDDRRGDEMRAVFFVNGVANGYGGQMAERKRSFNAEPRSRSASLTLGTRGNRGGGESGA